jgi:alpha-1,3-glucosyltransferase
MMYGIMIYSIAFAYEEKWLRSALCYAVLLNFKHIFLYSAPAFGLLYLKRAVLDQKSVIKFVCLAF